LKLSGQYALVVAALAVSALCAADASRSPRMIPHDLIGAWRLVDIDVEGPAGREADPFYGSGSRGLLLYDASGWFAVQIEGSGRPPYDSKLRCSTRTTRITEPGRLTQRHRLSLIIQGARSILVKMRRFTPNMSRSWVGT
jgi:hypothetical protein